LKILFIAPIPPPINGQSKASIVLLEKLQLENNDVEIINLSKYSLKNGLNSIRRVFDVIIILVDVWSKRKNNDIIYLSLAESFFGNLRDLFIYGICYKSRHKIFIHMLGGAGMKEILSGNGIQKKVNVFFIKNIGGVIVEGPVNFETFSKIISVEKIFIVPNFAEDFLFVENHEIKTKYSNLKTIQILYLSNLIPGKGYDELADAFIDLPLPLQKEVNIVFVGGFESKEDEDGFVMKIQNYEGLKYIGKFIDGEKKRELYCNSHVFCLPTYYPFEGQPISILEAYATGCVVITTDHSGIPFIFSDKKNGFIVEKKSVLSLKNAIENTLNNKNELEITAFYNRDMALEKYRTSIYETSIHNIFQNFLGK
jgi:glycosyltransferase involved in cell wall biosynthesis